MFGRRSREQDLGLLVMEDVRSEEIALPKDCTMRTEWVPEQISAQMPASLVIAVCGGQS
jgi:hypothetical protein